MGGGTIWPLSREPCALSARPCHQPTVYVSASRLLPEAPKSALPGSGVAERGHLLRPHESPLTPCWPPCVQKTRVGPGGPLLPYQQRLPFQGCVSHRFLPPNGEDRGTQRLWGVRLSCQPPGSARRIPARCDPRLQSSPPQPSSQPVCKHLLGARGFPTPWGLCPALLHSPSSVGGQQQISPPPQCLVMTSTVKNREQKGQVELLPTGWRGTVSEG